MRINKKQKSALAVLNYDLFSLENLNPPAPATLYTKIREHARNCIPEETESPEIIMGRLPGLSELDRMFDRFNWMYFEGKLPKVRIEYSSRMTSAGSYTPDRKVIKIGRKYHEVFPGELADTLKHEMIHILHFRHDRMFKVEANRIGASVRARTHPLLQKSPRYVYECRHCGRLYPRQKQLRMASCGICTPGKKYDSRYKLSLVKTQEGS